VLTVRCCRSFQAKELSLLLPALSSLGYKPRPEVCRTIIAQVGGGERCQQRLMLLWSNSWRTAPGLLAGPLGGWAGGSAEAAQSQGQVASRYICC